MLDIAQRIKRIQGSERSQRKAAPPEDAIRLDLGEPDFPTPMHIQDAALRAMRDQFTHYGNPYGDQELREAVCLSLDREYGVSRTPENVLVTAGAIEAIHAVSGTYLDPGDEALILDPDYSAYTESVMLFGGTPVPAPLGARLQLDFEGIEDRITDRTKLFFLSNPSNPTARVFSKSEVIRLAEIVDRHRLLLVVDEVYSRLTYLDSRFFSICELDELRDRVILLNSFSKTYAMTGWRVGYVVAEPAVIRALLPFHKSMVTCVNVPAQKACVAALTGSQECVESMKGEYKKRRELVAHGLQDADRIDVFPCHGAFYFFPRFEHRLTSREMTDSLATNGVLVRSGTEFGQNGEHHLRISFATSRENLEEGLRRLNNALVSVP